MPQCKKVNIKQQEIRGFSAVSLSKKLNSEISIGDAQNRQKKKASPSGELTDSRSKRGRRRRDRGRRWRGLPRRMRCYHICIIKINLISPCSHPDTHPNFNREVCHSLTWHSSESESALERFEPVAVVQQLPDGRGSVFAPVAARRQKEIKRGILSSFCPFRSFRTSEKNSKREVS